MHIQVLNGLITPVLLIFILILANRKSVLGPAANGPAYRVLAGVSVVSIGALALAVVVLQALGIA